jgi:hypothetical protein
MSDISSILRLSPNVLLCSSHLKMFIQIGSKDLFALDYTYFLFNTQSIFLFIAFFVHSNWFTFDLSFSSS